MSNRLSFHVTDHAVRRYVERVLCVRIKARDDGDAIQQISRKIPLQAIRSHIVHELLDVRAVEEDEHGRVHYVTRRARYVVRIKGQDVSVITVLLSPRRKFLAREMGVRI